MRGGAPYPATYFMPLPFTPTEMEDVRKAVRERISPHAFMGCSDVEVQR